jgi:hypothetical protein
MKNIYGILSSSPKVAKNPNNVASYRRGFGLVGIESRIKAVIFL